MVGRAGWRRSPGDIATATGELAPSCRGGELFGREGLRALHIGMFPFDTTEHVRSQSNKPKRDVPARRRRRASASTAAHGQRASGSGFEKGAGKQSGRER